LKEAQNFRGKKGGKNHLFVKSGLHLDKRETGGHQQNLEKKRLALISSEVKLEGETPAKGKMRVYYTPERGLEAALRIRRGEKKVGKGRGGKRGGRKLRKSRNAWMALERKAYASKATIPKRATRRKEHLLKGGKGRGRFKPIGKIRARKKGGQLKQEENRFLRSFRSIEG